MPRRLEPKVGAAELASSPLGVRFGVEQSSFPYYPLARFVAPNLMAGNVVPPAHCECRGASTSRLSIEGHH